MKAKNALPERLYKHTVRDILVKTTEVGEEFVSFRVLHYDKSLDISKLATTLDPQKFLAMFEVCPEFEDWDAERAIEVRGVMELLSTFKVYGPVLDVVKAGYCYDEGDEDTPFFSEAFLYNLVGKDDARTILYAVRNLARLTGVYEKDEILPI